MEKQHKIAARIGKAAAWLGVTLLCLLVILAGLVGLLLRGPSPTAARIACSTLRETSALRWIPPLYLPQETLDAYLPERTEFVETAQINPSLIRIAEGEARTEDRAETPDLEVVDIAFGTSRGKLMIVRDPKSVILGVSGRFGVDPGLQLTELVEKYGGAAGINAGGFIDDNGLGNGGTPTGLVLCDGELLHGAAYETYSVIGLDGDGILHVGTMTGRQAMDAGICWGVSFVTHDGIASSLIINGEVQKQNLGPGVNPRTAIGQRADGALLLLVLDGRSSKTIGATLENVVDILLDYGAVNAGNLDGGSSSVMVCGGEIVNHCASITGPRRIPTAFIVRMEEAGND